MHRPLPPWLDRTRRYALYLAAALALLLLGLDRYAAFAHRPDPDSREVAIYTTAWCPYCAKLRASLAASDIPYVEHDVETSLQGQLGFWTLRGRGVPVSVVGPEVVYGYDVARLAGALQKLGYNFVPVSADRAQTSGSTQSALTR
ncbi:MAG: glutaredoxin family protein [Burkholderiales bacterium]